MLRFHRRIGLRAAAVSSSRESRVRRGAWVMTSGEFSAFFAICLMAS